MQLILGLGSNVGDRETMLGAALESLAWVLGPLKRSAVQETAALLPPGAPPEWNVPYLNMAALAETALPPESVLELAKRIEQALGRQDRGRWGPREIDIDILAYGDTVMNTPALIIPHAQLLSRDFALKPLAELAPDWRYPVEGEHFGRTAQELAGCVAA